MEVKVDKHPESYEQFVAKIKKDYPYTNKKDMDFNDLSLATIKYFSSRTYPFQHDPYNEIVTISAYLGKLDYAIEALDNFTAAISEWPDGPNSIFGSVAKWRAGLLALINNSDKLRENVEQELIKHKLTDFPDYGLIWPQNPLKIWKMPSSWKWTDRFKD
jgi:hypothetical protein